MSKAVSHLPTGFHNLTIHLTVKGAAAYIDFLKLAFDAVEAYALGPGGRLLNASVRVGDSVMMLNDVFPEFDGEAYRSGKAFRLTLYSPDANARWAKALAAGCKISMPIRDQFWGDRYGEVEDPFGFVWAIATHLKDLTSDEIEERRKKMFAGSPPGQTGVSVVSERFTSRFLRLATLVGWIAASVVAIRLVSAGDSPA